MANAGRSQGAPRGKSRGGFLLGVFIGLIVGLSVALGIALYLSKTPFPFSTKGKPQAAKDGDAAKSPPPIAGMPATRPPSGEKPKFDFYKILPGGEEAVSEKELTAAAKGQQSGQRDVYFLQAGSFQNPADADNLKARLAIIGFESSVEPTALPDKGTWYRVRVGPYSRVDELNKARSQLAANGVEASLVRLRDAAAKP